MGVASRRSLPVIARESAGEPAEAAAPRRTRAGRHKVLLVYPRPGFSGVFVNHMPLSLLYASVELVKRGVDVEIFDLRLHPDTWRDDLRARVSRETLVVGLSVMTGRPILDAIDVGRFVKSLDPGVRVVWGGPHVTFAPETVFDEPSVDHAIAGYGSKPLDQLVAALLADESPADIPGLWTRRGAEVVHWPEVKSFEHIDWREIPYHLIPDMAAYGQFDTGRVVASMYSVLGCPYQCTFCSSPAQYRGTPGRLWVRLEVEEVVDHIAYVVERFGADFIYFIDDDSFVSLAHVERIIDEIRRRGIKTKLGFRGARINEIKRMSDAYLAKLVEAGTEIMHVGVESGSDRVLALIKKDCTVDDILECNRKFARHPELTVGYNFIIGVPSETLDELRATRDLWFKLLADNPRAIIFTPNRFRPLPGTELFETAVRDFGYDPPRTLRAWAEVELENEAVFPWYPEGMAEFCNLMVIASYAVDDKIFRFSEGSSALYRALRAAARAYGPIARFRLRHGIDALLVEHHLYRAAKAALMAVQRANGGVWQRVVSTAARRPPSARAAVTSPVAPQVRVT